MKTIIFPLKVIDTICGRQQYRKDIEYRLTKHCLCIPSEDGDLMYHTLTKALLLIEPNDRRQDLQEVLVNNWFMVPLNFDECKQVDGARKVASLLKKDKKWRTSFTILTTTDCNARCFYCYEMGIQRYPMTPETAQDIGHYIVHACGGEKVKLSWFGGEPLYNAAVIDIICRALQKNEVEYSSTLTSNGYYLDAQTARNAVKNWHVTTVQITIDGTELVYNRTKAFTDKDEESPYRRVLRNIESALDAGLEICVRMNMDKSNADDLFLLADELGKHFQNRKGFFVHVVLLKQYVGHIHAFESREKAECTRKALIDKLDKMGFVRHDHLTRGLRLNQCMADNDTCEVILPDGRIEKCEHINDSQVVGSIYNPLRDETKIQEWKKIIYHSDCFSCELYPMCINLALCPRISMGCDSLRRAEKTNRIKKLVMDAYVKTIYDQEGKTYEDQDELYIGGDQW